MLIFIERDKETNMILNFFILLYRLQNLKNTFETKYGESPVFYAYAPGRVNLIGNYIFI